jgi:predicted dehydrogenase
MLASGPETRLVGLWARQSKAAEALAHRLGCHAYPSFEALLAEVDAVSFCVPPYVQAQLAPKAAAAGKALLLEKPLADSIEGARAIVEAVTAACVGSLVVFTARFAPEVRLWLAQAQSLDSAGGRSWFLSDSLMSGPFAASPWRHRYGALFDLGPHAIDLIEAALGPVEVVHASQMPGSGATIVLGHKSGAVSTVQVSGSVAGQPACGVEIFGEFGQSRIDTMNVDWSTVFQTLRAEFASVARGEPHACDAVRGLVVQELLMASADAITAAKE